MLVNDIFLERLPKIDLHGYDRDIARVLVNDFVDESVKMEYEEIVIIHGIGSGILRNMVQELLKKDKRVVSFYIDGFNNGCTVVKLKNRN